MPRWKNVLQTSEEVYRIKRNALLQEATRIIARRGFHNTSLDEIAEALQVAKGTLYNYVKDKHEILLECHKMSLDIGDRAFSFADENGRSGYAKLRLMLRAYMTWLNGALGGGGITSDVTALRASDRRAVITRRDHVQERMVEYFEEGFSDGTIRRVDPKLAVYTIMGAVNSIQSWYSPKGRLSIDDIVEQMLDILMSGISTTADAAHVDAPVPPYNALEGPVRQPARRRSKSEAAKSDDAKKAETQSQKKRETSVSKQASIENATSSRPVKRSASTRSPARRKAVKS